MKDYTPSVTAMTTGNVDLGIPQGQPVALYENSPGLIEGYGRVVNGFEEGLEYFDHYDDGDTVVAANPGDPDSLPIADAYWLLRRIYSENIARLLRFEIENGYCTVDEVLVQYAEHDQILKLLTPNAE